MNSASVLSPAARWAAFSILLVGGFLPPLDFFIVNVALPSVRDSLAASPAQVQLVISGYAAAYAVFLITGGRLGDLYGRRRLFVIGLAAFTATSALCGFAPRAGVLVVGRVLEGVAAAMLGPQVLAAIRALYSDAELGRALGPVRRSDRTGGGDRPVPRRIPDAARFVRVGLAVGIPDQLADRIATVAGAFAFVPPIGPTGKPKLDLGGAVLVSLTLACLVLPLSEGRQQGWPAWTFVMLGAVPFLVGGLLRFEAGVKARGGMPLIDLALFRIRGFGRGVLVATLFYFTSSFYLFFAIYQQEGRGLDALATGVAILPYGVGLFLGPLLRHRCRCGCGRICWASAWRSRSPAMPPSWSRASCCSPAGRWRR